jgi:hypothetical protein
MMSGTSGSSADAALAVKFAARLIDGQWSAPGLSDDEAVRAIAALSHHYFRTEGQGPGEWMMKSINALRQAVGLDAKYVDTPHVFTHSYPEIYSGVALALKGANADDEQAMRKSTIEAAEVLSTNMGNSTNIDSGAQ